MKVIFRKRNFTSLLISLPLKYHVKNYSNSVIGGPKLAEIDVTGSDADLWELAEYARQPVYIISDKGDTVWWGYVAEININIGRWSIGINIDSMANYVGMIYEDDTNNGQPEKTAWAQAVDSITEYGRRETLLTSSSSNSTHALAALEKYLNEKKYPIPMITPRVEGPNGATLFCRGWFDTLSWEYASIPTNLAYGYPSIQPLECPFGYDNYKISVTGMEYTLLMVTLKAANSFAIGDCITVAGVNAGFNVENIDGNWICEAGTNNTQVVFTVTNQPTGATPQTDNHGTITDMISQVTAMAYTLKVVTLTATNSFAIGELITVEGVDAGFNVENIDGNWICQIGTDSTQVVFTVDIQPTGATPQTDNHGTIAKMPTEEIAQSLWFSGDCNLASISIYVKKVGTPTDNLNVSLNTNTDDITPGTELTVGSVAGTVLNTDFAWVNIPVTPYAFVDYNSYFIKLSRSGGLDQDNYYVVMLDVRANNPLGKFNVLIGDNWIIGPEADMPFELYSNDIIETTQQISTLVANFGQFIGGMSIENQSGLYTASVRDGNGNALYEITELMKMGTINYRRLLVKIDEYRKMILYEEPAISTRPYLMLIDGSLRDPYGTILRKEICPVGLWVRLKDIVPASLDTTKLADPTLIFIDDAEYFPDEDLLNLTSRGSVDPFQIGTPKDG